MALIGNLHDVAQILAEHIGTRLGFADVQPGNPRPVGATTGVGVRLTLLYVTPQPGHRNDPWERGTDDILRPPPLSLSCFYLVTTSGADADDPIAAQNALGEVLKLYQDEPVLILPLTGGPGSPPPAFTPLGEGQLTVQPVTVSLEQLDKLWTPLEAELQPFVLYEVGPVQLVPLRPPAPAGPVVGPGGIALTVLATGPRPVIAEVTPIPVRSGGRLRLDLLQPTPLQATLIDALAAPPAAVTAADGAVLIDLEAAGLRHQAHIL